ncbi:hypothetical protein GCM10017783_19250 [Deinococcus piscis]|uniref:Uncharacterized protein n=1 Tax=Deinococcus piscis TaxID=394230 RepID=A0ABQ3K8I4_9DEIO|nr:hypothetical protein GCM10017783_19250 [Deinococcus piscis]
MFTKCWENAPSPDDFRPADFGPANFGSGTGAPKRAPQAQQDNPDQDRYSKEAHLPCGPGMQQ